MLMPKIIGAISMQKKENMNGQFLIMTRPSRSIQNMLMPITIGVVPIMKKMSMNELF